MILFALAGYFISRFAGIQIAFPVAVILGILVAPFIPAKTACSIGTQPADPTDELPPAPEASEP